MNPRISAKERNLLKGAVRRVFSRSDLRRQAVARSIIQHQDPTRPRVTKWSRCSSCQVPTPTYQIEVDHVDPIVPTHKRLEDMTWDELVERVWCSPDNLSAVCKLCHRQKTKAENKLRRHSKKIAA